MANDEMYTPSWIIEAAREAMGSIGLDPCTSYEANKTVKADRFFTKEDDGLSWAWHGNVWLNPPYSRDNMPTFVDHLVENRRPLKACPVTQCCLLCNAQTAAKWFHKALNHCDCMCIFNKRISFIDAETMLPKKGNDRSQVLFYFGRNGVRFYRIFSQYGTVVQKVAEL